MMRKVLLVMFVLASSALAQDRPPPAVVEVAVVEEQNMAPMIWVPGTVISREDSNIASEVEGVLTMVVDVGDSVKAGQALAKVNTRQLKLQRRHNAAELARLESQLKFAQQQLGRTESLLETNSTAQFRIDELQMERDVLKQEIVLAQVALDQTQYLLDRSNIVAPFSGVVVERFHQPGEHIGVGEELLRLVNTGTLEISARAPIEVSGYITPQQTITIKNEGKERITTLRSVVPVGDPKSRMLEVRVHLDGDWVIGDAVSVALQNGPGALSMVIPRDALVLRNESVYVFRINDGVAEKIDVQPGIGDNSAVAVVGKLKKGDVIVTRGAERLDDGRAVDILNEVAGR